MEPRFQTERGVQKFDLVIAAKKEMIILDVQIPSNYVVFNLSASKREKLRSTNSAR